jgi:hypothetical protein
MLEFCRSVVISDAGLLVVWRWQARFMAEGSKAATSTILIAFTVGSEPVKAGLIESFNQQCRQLFTGTLRSR